MAEDPCYQLILQALDEMRVVSFESRQEDVIEDQPIDHAVECAKKFFVFVIDINDSIHDGYVGAIWLSAEMRWKLEKIIYSKNKGAEDFQEIWKDIRTLCRQIDYCYNPRTYDSFVKIWEKYFPGIKPLSSFY